MTWQAEAVAHLESVVQLIEKARQASVQGQRMLDQTNYLLNIIQTTKLAIFRIETKVLSE